MRIATHLLPIASGCAGYPSNRSDDVVQDKMREEDDTGGALAVQACTL